MNRLPSYLTLAATFLFAVCTVAQSQNTANTLRLDTPDKAASVPLEHFNFMAGSWKGTGMGGQVEEIWTQASGGSLMGAFKLLDEDGTSFYEFIHILETDQGVVLQLKHFNPDLTGWEEKEDYVSFPLVKVEKNAAYFRGLTYRVPEPDRLEVYLALRRGGETQEVSFTFDRVR